MASYTIKDVPSVKNDPLRAPYIGKTLPHDQKIQGKTGGMMLTLPSSGGLFFWPSEIELAA